MQRMLLNQHLLPTRSQSTARHLASDKHILKSIAYFTDLLRISNEKRFFLGKTVVVDGEKTQTIGRSELLERDLVSSSEKFK